MEKGNTDDEKSNPQKYFMKFLCKLLYIGGLGDCWYEDSWSPITHNIYPIWACICHFYFMSVIISEIMAMFRKDLTVKEQNDTIQFITAHPTVYLKIVFLILQKKRIRDFFRKIFEDTRSIYSCIDLEQAAIRRTKWYCSGLAITMILCLSTSTIDGIKMHYSTGIPVRTLVTYWPNKTDTGIFVEIVRFFIQLYWWYIVTVMVIIDSVCLSSLIFLAYRFRALGQYFMDLRKITNNDRKVTAQEQEDKMVKAFVTGINLHVEILWCAQRVADALGNIYSVQVAQSIGLLAICLIKLVRLERSLTFLVANLAFIQCMIALTATYMTAAGDITFEAAQLPTSIFHCGWDRLATKAKVKPLLTVMIQRSQVPVVMTAFGIFNLSYATFITILRSSYSFFAVMY